MESTFFYVIGISLVVIALVISAIGARDESFPSTRMLRIGLPGVILVVIATATAAVILSEHEQQKRLDEANTAAAAESVAGSEANQASEAGQGAGGAAQPGGTEPAADGAQLFSDSGCTGCHTLAAAGSTAQVGPNLDDVLADQDENFIRTSIIDPSAFVEKGFPDGTMPQTYADQLSDADLSALVTYVYDSTHGK